VIEIRNAHCSCQISSHSLYISAEPLWVILWTVQQLLCLFDYNGPSGLGQNGCVLPTTVYIVFLNFHACYVFKCMILYIWWFIYVCIYLFIYLLTIYVLTHSMTYLSTTYPPTYPHTHLPTHLPTYLPTYPPTCTSTPTSVSTTSSTPVHSDSRTHPVIHCRCNAALPCRAVN
jgi:hypothetical protein